MSLLPITEVAAKLGLTPDDLIPYGHDKAKVRLDVLDRPRTRPGKGRLVLVSAITPTPAGEGKTTTSIGLVQGLERIGHSACAALREPSLGPVFGIKGGGTGGGQSRLQPSAEINLHFTGDLHAVTSAHNLLAALIDNYLHFRLEPRLKTRRMLWRRVMDMNDRSLRRIITGLGGLREGVPRETGFDITAASEVMAILCLSENLDDLRARLERTLIGFWAERGPATAGDIGAAAPMLALLKDAIQPNLVQTTEGTPAFVHGGPFANIAHGCNSVIATRMALRCADWTVTEAGFGFDLGAEKFFDIKCTSAGLDPAAVVLVATVRALKYHGGTRLDAMHLPDPAAVAKGLPNLDKHVENIRIFEEVPIVALNRRDTDTDEEIEVVRCHCEKLGVPFAVSDHFARGGEGAMDLARILVEHAEKKSKPFRPLYTADMPVFEKIRAVATKIYGATDVILSKTATEDIQQIERLGYGRLPICIAKTQSSLSDDPKRRGRPRDFEVAVREVQINAGAGFLVVLTGDILRMPGLPREPQSQKIDVRNGEIVGVE